MNDVLVTLSKEAAGYVEDLVRLNIDSAQGFTAAADMIEDKSLAASFREYAAQRDANAEELKAAIAYNGEEAYDSGMSVDDAALMAEEGVDPAAFMAAPGRGFLGSVQFTAGTLREQAELRVGYDPIVPSNLFHCQGWGKMTEGKKNRLKRAAMWFQEIPGVSLV